MFAGFLVRKRSFVGVLDKFLHQVAPVGRRFVTIADNARIMKQSRYRIDWIACVPISVGAIRQNGPRIVVVFDFLYSSIRVSTDGNILN
jgi:hypothetical protein